jgi:ligand-binding sensor domain-containing protein
MAQQFDFENYSVREGLAQSQVYALLQDRNGYIWMGTRGGGLSRFDGQHFEQFTEKDGIASNYIAALYQDSIGQIWIGCTDGLSKYDGRKFEGVLIDSTQTLSILSIKEINQQLFVGTHNGLYLKNDDGSFEWVQALRNISIRSIFHASDQTTWLATNQGPYFIKNDSVQVLTRKNGIRNRDIMGFAETADGQFYIGLFGNGVVQLDSSRTKVKRYLPNLNSRLIQSFYQDRRKRIWMGSQNSGLNVYHTIDSSFNYLNERDGLAKNDVRAIMEDSWGNIWIGTSGGGVSKYAGQTFEHLDQSNGLNEDYIYSIAADSSNQLWIAAYNKGINIITDSSIIALNARTGFKNVKVKALFKDREDRMWVGTEGSGLALQDTSGFKYFKAREDGLAGNWIRAITQDSSGHIWVGTASSGISELIPIDTSFYDFTIKKYKREEGLPSLSINDLHIDSLNRIWMATRGSGIACMQNGKVIKTIKRALPSTQVRSLVEDQFGYLWVGMADAGVARMSIYQDTLEIIPYDDLTSNNVYLLLLDDEQNLWVGSE